MCFLQNLPIPNSILPDNFISEYLTLRKSDLPFFDRPKKELADDKIHWNISRLNASKTILPMFTFIRNLGIKTINLITTKNNLVSFCNEHFPKKHFNPVTFKELHTNFKPLCFLIKKSELPDLLLKERASHGMSILSSQLLDNLPNLFNYAISYFIDEENTNTNVVSKEHENTTLHDYVQKLRAILTDKNLNLLTYQSFAKKRKNGAKFKINDSCLTEFRIRSDPQNLVEASSTGQKIHYFFDTIANDIPFTRYDEFCLDTSTDLTFGHFKYGDFRETLLFRGLKNRSFIMGADRGYRIPTALSVRTSGIFIDNNIEQYPQFINSTTSYDNIYNRKKRQNRSIKKFQKDVYSTVFGVAIPERLVFNDTLNKFFGSETTESHYIRKYYRQLQSMSRKKNRMNTDIFHNVSAETLKLFFHSKSFSIVFENISNVGVEGNFGGLSTALSGILWAKLLNTTTYKFYINHFMPDQRIQFTAPSFTSQMCSYGLAEVKVNEIPNPYTGLNRKKFTFSSCHPVKSETDFGRDSRGFYFLHNHTVAEDFNPKGSQLVLRDNNASNNMTFLFTPPAI